MEVAPLFMLRDALLARPKREVCALAHWFDKWVHVVGLREHVKQWHRVGSAVCPAHLPAEEGTCPGNVRKLEM